LLSTIAFVGCEVQLVNNIKESLNVIYQNKIKKFIENKLMCKYFLKAENKRTLSFTNMECNNCTRLFFSFFFYFCMLDSFVYNNEFVSTSASFRLSLPRLSSLFCGISSSSPRRCTARAMGASWSKIRYHI
jgi:hypothetical protein